MKNIFLTESESSKKEYKEVMGQTVASVIDVFSDGKAYSGPTPEELHSLIHQ